MPFSQDVIAIREKYRLSQQKLAKALEVPRGAVAHWEQGLHMPRPEIQTRLCLVLLHGPNWKDPCYRLPSCGENY